MGEPRRLSFTPRNSSTAVRLAEVAEAQDGVLGWSDLLGAGLSRAGVSRWVERGHLHQRYPRVYTLGHRVLTMRGKLRAALFYAGPAAALSYVTAAWWWEIWGNEPKRIHVSAPEKRRSYPALKVHRPRSFEATVHKGLAVTTVPQTLLDLAAGLRFNDLRQALAEAEFKELLDLGELESVLGRGRPGSAALRRAAAHHLPELARTRSELERLLVFLCETYKIPMPAINAKVLGFTVDALWKEQRVIVEVDGGPAHASPARMRNDRRRDLILRRAGYTVLRYSWDPDCRRARPRRRGRARSSRRGRRSA